MSGMTDPGRAGLQVSFAAGTLRNPVMLASGCCGYGPELAGALPMDQLGGLVTKTVTLRPRPGNPPPRVVETPGGMLNSIGLENVGVERFLEEKLPRLRELPLWRVVSVGGYEPAEYARMMELLEPHEGFDAVELNLSCPNVRQGGLDLGTDPAKVRETVAGVVARTARPVWAKLTPNTSDIVALGRAAQEGGAHGVSAINTLVGTAVHWKTRTALPSPGQGGLSGPCLKPVALSMVRRLSAELRIPVIGIGGISDARDVLEFLLAGASAVQVGTALFLDPSGAAFREEALLRELEAVGASSLSELRGSLAVRALPEPRSVFLGTRA